MKGFFKRRKRAQVKKEASRSLFVEVLEGLGGRPEQIQPEPSDDYLERVSMLDDVVRDCTNLSRSLGGIKSPTSQHYYASLLFTAMCTRGVSMAILAPCSPWADKIIEHWDYASLTGIARTLLELRLGFYYLCVEDISRVEWECRWNVFNLHDCCSRIRLFKAEDEIHGRLQNPNMSIMLSQADELRDRLNTNHYFLGHSDKQQIKFLKGETAYILALEDVAARAGIGKTHYQFYQKLFSSHVHALPFSFYRIGDDGGRGRGLPSPVEENYTSLCLSLTCTLLVAARDEMIALFDGLMPE